MSAVLKPKKTETIYDHSVTETELSELFYGFPETHEDYLIGLGSDSLLVDIVRLYELRNQPDIAKRYAAMIEDPSIRSEIATMGCCVEHS